MAISASQPFALTQGILFTGEAFVEGHSLLLNKGHVLDLVAGDKVPDSFISIPCPGSILAPGFIDCQVNGGGNVLFNATPDSDSVLAIAAAHRKTGTTRLLPTIITDAPDVTHAAIAAMHEARKRDASVLGIHIEGPHISVEQKGTHALAYIRALTESDLPFYKPVMDECVLVTLAPENASFELIQALAVQGTLVALGHTAAAPEALRQALAAGATGFTHLYSAMGPIASRAPGPAGTALDDQTSWCGMIGDGQHVAPELMRIAMRAKPENKLYFVSDAMAAAGADKPEPFLLNGDMIYPMDGACRHADGRLAGALMTLGEIVSYAIRDLKLAPERALRMASTIPAAFLGVDRTLGKLLPGYKADIVALDHFFRAQKVWRDGKQVV